MPADGVCHHCTYPDLLQKARGVDPERRELVGERPARARENTSSTCEHKAMEVKGNQWTFKQQHQSKRPECAMNSVKQQSYIAGAAKNCLSLSNMLIILATIYLVHLFAK